MEAGQVASAVLRLQVSDSKVAESVSGGRLHTISACTWGEGTITWATQPAIDGALLQEIGAVARRQVVAFDITQAIRGDGSYCFALDSAAANAVIYNSREAASGAPEVAINLAVTALPTATPTPAR